MNDPRPSNVLLTLTTHLLERIEALGYTPGETPAGVLPWLVGKAEEMRAECDAFATYREMTTTALGIEPSSCAEDVAEAVNEMRLTLAAEQGRAEGAPSEGWRWTNACWFHPATCMVVEPAGRLWRLNPDTGDKRRWRLRQLEPSTARAMMLAADKALETP